VILSGGPESVTGRGTPRIPKLLLTLDVPILGICYGMQSLATQLGGRVEGSRTREFGYARVQVEHPGALLEGIADQMLEGGRAELDVWMSHGDKVTVLPPGFRVMASTASAPIAAMCDDARRIYGVQFHPEVTHTRQGGKLLERFVRGICGCTGLWNAGSIIEDQIVRVRAQVGADKVLLGLSGGVDSSVVAALLHRAIGTQLTCVFVDTGLLRLDEGNQVMEMFARNMGVRVIRVNAEREFLQKLKGVSDPERKRKIIGRTFIEIFDRKAAQIRGVKWLAQGTIYPDVIESAASKHGHAHVIKSHHNVGGLLANMKLKLVEPLRELFKDEVRELGQALGISEDLVWRHPFPGPGLAIRVLGEITAERLAILREADDIMIQEITAAGVYKDIGQAFVVLLPVKSVGVMGDSRTYEQAAAIRCVTSADFMTADWYHMDYALLGRIANRIINEVRGINRVCYDVSSKPPATIEWE